MRERSNPVRGARVISGRAVEEKLSVENHPEQVAQFFYTPE